MFWVLLVGGFLLYLFFSTKRDESIKVKKQGGFYLKYKILIDYYASEPNIIVEKRNNSSITLALKDKQVITRYTISHGFEEVFVFFHQQSLAFGEHSLKWKFPETMPQDHMIEMINQEINLYYKNLMA